MKSKLPTLTIAIPSYELGESLRLTLKSLLPLCNSAQIKKIVIAVDGNHVSKIYRQSFSHSKLQWLTLPTREGQSSRLNDIFKTAKTDYLLITNDDVLFGKKTIKSILQALQSGADLFTTQVLPKRTDTFLQKTIAVGNDLTQMLSKEMGLYRNYLSCNGRCLVLSSKFYKNLKLPKSLWNNDAFIYFQCEEQHLHHRHLLETEVYYQLPQLLADYIKQWRKFHFSQEENQLYFTNSIAHHYQMNTALVVWSLMKSLRVKPLLTLCYLGLQFFLKMFANNQSMAQIKNKSSFWETDQSTKKIRVV